MGAVVDPPQPAMATEPTTTSAVSHDFTSSNLCLFCVAIHY